MTSAKNNQLVGLKLATVARNYTFSTNGLALKLGDWVVAYTPRGQELGQVISAPNASINSPDEPFLIVRQATNQDFIQARRQALQTAEALNIVKAQVLEHQLPMTVLDVFITLDGNRLVVEFAAEMRVDFRALVRDLASRLKKRIELHQIGTRDRSILAGGYGVCGRPVCCSLWMRDFASVSIKIAKAQGLSLNPGRISGACGRLMCCLKYEYDSDEEPEISMPNVGEAVVYNNSEANVKACDPTQGTVTLVTKQLEEITIGAEVAKQLVQRSSETDNAKFYTSDSRELTYAFDIPSDNPDQPQVNMQSRPPETSKY